MTLHAARTLLEVFKAVDMTRLRYLLAGAMLALATKTGAQPAVESIPVSGGTRSALESRQWRGFLDAVTQHSINPPDVSRLEALCAEAVKQLKAGEDPVEICIAAALSSTDPRGRYVGREERTRQLRDATPPRGAVGLEMFNRQVGEPPKIASVIPGSPASKGDIRAGDLLLSVDGVDTAALVSADIVPLLRGPLGSTAQLRLLRAERAFDISVVRTEVPLPVVKAQMHKEVLYARLWTFRVDSARQFYDSVDKALRASATPPRSLILDLRANTGGALDYVARVGSLFVKDGTPLVESTVRNEGRRTIESFVQLGPNVIRQKSVDAFLRSSAVFVLVDANTANGGEVLAQFLKDQRGAKLAGVRSAGIDVLRQQFAIGDDSAVILTIGRLSGTKGNSWSNTGVEIDVELPVVKDTDFGILPQDEALARLLIPAGEVAPAATSTETTAPTDSESTAGVRCSPVSPAIPAVLTKDPAFVRASVVAAVELLAPGEVGSVTIKRSSGYPVLDDAVVDALKHMQCTFQPPLVKSIRVQQAFDFRME